MSQLLEKLIFNYRLNYFLTRASPNTEQRRRRAAAVVSPAARAMSGQSGPGRRRCFRTSRVSYPALSRCRFSVVHHVRWCSGAATSRCCVSALPVTGHSVADPAGQLKIVYPHGALFENIGIPLGHISSVHAHSPKQTTTVGRLFRFFRLSVCALIRPDVA